MTWNPTDEEHAELARARENHIPYVPPAKLGEPTGRKVRMPADTGVLESFTTQQHVWQTGGVRLLLRPVAGAAPAYDDRTGAEWVRYLLTAANPLGRACTQADNERLHAKLGCALERTGATVMREVTTLPPDRSWWEDTWLVTDIDEATVAALAHEYEQPAYTVWTPETLTLVSTHRWDRMPMATRSRWEVDTTARTCPMRSDDHPTDRCTMHGGPWISASIHASVLWKSHRQALLSRLGCDACDDGRRPFAGPFGRAVGPIELGSHIVASRYGGYAWR